jgi:hypothetical protein
MAHTHVNDEINDLVIELHRSLAQYTAESWPWTSSRDQPIKEAVMDLVARQRQDVAKLVEFLRGRRHRIDFGIYPHAYTGYHYVSLNYLFSKLIEHQQKLVDLLEEAAGRFSDDPEAAKIVGEVAASQREGMVRLLSVTPPEPAATSA